MPVYIIRAGQHGPVKIGFAEDVANRLAKMQSDNHERLTVLRTFVGGETEELGLHIRFADQRLHGEWFGFSRLMLGDVGLEEIPQAPLPIEPTPEFLIRIDALTEIGLRIKACRERADRSQRFLAAAVGVTGSAVAQWEMGLHRPTLNNLRRIAAVFNISLDELLRASQPLVEAA